MAAKKAFENLSALTTITSQDRLCLTVWNNNYYLCLYRPLFQVPDPEIYLITVTPILYTDYMDMCKEYPTIRISSHIHFFDSTVPHIVIIRNSEFAPLNENETNVFNNSAALKLAADIKVELNFSV